MVVKKLLMGLLYNVNEFNYWSKMSSDMFNYVFSYRPTAKMFNFHNDFTEENTKTQYVLILFLSYRMLYLCLRLKSAL